MNVLVTGAAGFIGFHLARRLAELPGYTVTGLDNLNDYYDPSLKWARLRELGITRQTAASGRLVASASLPGFRFIALDLADRAGCERLFAEGAFQVVINLAAQAGVRYSLDNPYAYVESNVVGFLNILEGCRHHRIDHLIYASSSSVYGLNRQMPFSTSDAVDHPVSLYAATKRSNELMAHTYSHLYGLPTTGLRFFTVYGPFGRPDMAYSLFTKAIKEGRPIKVFNHGRMLRDFTYIDDIVEGIVRLIDRPPMPGADAEAALTRPDTSTAPFALYNIGNNKPVELLEFIRIIEDTLRVKAQMEMLPMQPGDVEATFADIDGLRQLVGFKPSTPLEVGLPLFIRWYEDYYG